MVWEAGFRNYWEGERTYILVISSSTACVHQCSLNMKSGASDLKKPFTIIDWWEEKHLIIQILTLQALKKHFTDISSSNNRFWHQNCSNVPGPCRNNTEDLCHSHCTQYCFLSMSPEAHESFMHSTEGVINACRLGASPELPHLTSAQELCWKATPRPDYFQPGPGTILLCWLFVVSLLLLVSQWDVPCFICLFCPLQL